MEQRLILTINPGSTSTKIAVFAEAANGEPEEIYKESVEHDAGALAAFATMNDQLPYREKMVKESLASHSISVASLSAIVARGGLLPPIQSGAYTVNEDMVYMLTYQPDHEHASNLAAIIGYDLGKPYNIPVYIYDGVTVEEMDSVVMLTGRPECKRKGMGHNLNMRAMALKYAKEHGVAYKDCTVIVGHLGGGISVSLHHNGKIADIMSDETGPFSPERAGALPIYQLIREAFQEGMTEKAMMKRLKSQSGLYAYLGTKDSRDVERRIQAGDEKAKLVYEAMALNIAKCICSEAALVNGAVDAIILTGGIAYSHLFTDMIRNRVSFLAPVICYPGENEMYALAGGGLRVLRGEETPKEFVRNEGT